MNNDAPTTAEEEAWKAMEQQMQYPNVAVTYLDKPEHLDVTYELDDSDNEMLRQIPTLASISGTSLTILQQEEIAQIYHLHRMFSRPRITAIALAIQQVLA